MFTYSNKKEILRKKYLELRKSFSNDEIEDYSVMIFNHFVKKFQPIENQKVHLFLPIKKLNELNTQIFISYFFQKQIRVFVPKMLGNDLISVEIHPETPLIKNSWGILEPESSEDAGIKDFDFVITPLLYCDHKGNRVGYGKGFYDCFFSKINPEVKKIGITIFSPNEEIEDVSSTDVKVDYLITPLEILSFSGLL